MGQQFILTKGERSLTRIVAFLSALSNTRAWKLEITEHRAKRSDEQNRYLWGIVYRTICDHLPGWDANDIHEYCLGECYGWETLEGFGRKRLRPIRRSAKLSKMEFCDYIAFIQRRMAEHGIYIPDPGEELKDVA